MPRTDARGIASLGVAPDPNDVAVQVTDNNGALVGVSVDFYVPPPIPTVRLTADLGVPGDGVTPVSSIIPAALAGVAPGSRVIFDAPRYHIPETLYLTNLNGLTLVMNGALLYRGPEDPVLDDHLVEIEGYSNVVLEDPVLQGNAPDWRYNPTIEFNSALRVRGGDGLIVRRLVARNVGGDGFNVIGGRTLARNVLLEGADLAFCARQGVAIRNAIGVAVRRVVAQWIGRSAFDVEPLPNHVTENIEISDSFATHFQNSFLGAGGAAPITSLRFLRNRGIGGLQFAAIGAQFPVGTLEVAGNAYTWYDPEYVQTRSLGRVNLRATSLAWADNTLTFNTPPNGRGCVWAVERGYVLRSTFAGVGARDGGGLVIDAPDPSLIEVADVVVTDRNGAALPIIVR